MKRKLLFSFVFLFQVSFSFGQLAAIKKNIDELFFQIPLKASKFEIRTALHSNNNFSNIKNYQEATRSISADFREDYKCTYLGNNCQIVFWFKDGDEITEGRKIMMEYSEKEVAKCIKQYQELVSIFKKISFVSNEYKVANYKNEQSGVATNFSTTSDYKFKIPFIEITYRYMDYSDHNKQYPYDHVESYYVLEISLNDESVH